MKFQIPTDLRWCPERTAQLTAPLVDVDRLQGPSVCPRPGDPHDFPAPMVVGSDEHQEQYEQVCEMVSQLKQGIWPSRVMALYGLPEAIEQVPEALRRVILAKAMNSGMSVPMAAGYHVRMDRWSEPAEIMFRNVQLHGGELDHRFRFQSKASNGVEHFDLLAVIRAANHVGERVEDEMEKAFDSKSFHLFPRPYQCSNVSRSQFTIYPHDDGGDEHGEYVPGHAVNGAMSHVAVRDATKAPDECYAENRIIAALIGVLRGFAGLHYMTHCIRVLDHYDPQ